MSIELVSPRTWGRWIAPLLVATATLGFSAPAAAQGSKAAAEAAFDEGLAAFEAGRYAEACPKLGAAVELTRRESLGGLLLHAQCLEKTGRVASAWAIFREVASKAARAAQPDREAAAREGEARVAPLLHHVTLRVAPEVAALEGLVVSRGGEGVPAEAFGVKVPADPGPLAIRVEATGRTPHQRAFDVPTGAGTSEVAITLADLPPAAGVASPVGPPPGAVTAPPASSGADRREDGGGHGLLYGGLAVAAVGVGLIAVSTVVIAGAKGDYDDVTAACGDDGCNGSQVVSIEDAQSSGDVATILFVTGAVLTGLGATAIVIDLATQSGGSDGALHGPALEVGLGRAAFVGAW